MATCDISTLLAQAGSNKFFCLDRTMSRAVELQLWKNISSDTSTVAELLSQAASNSFVCSTPGVQNTVEIQLICNIIGGVGPAPPTCTNLVPNNATYTGFNNYTLTGLTIGATYTLHNNQVGTVFITIVLGGSSIGLFAAAADQTVNFTSGDSIVIHDGTASNGDPVLVTVCLPT